MWDPQNGPESATSKELSSDLVKNLMQLFPINVGKLILIGRLSKVLFGVDVLRDEK